jgi:hypothetical protein
MTRAGSLQAPGPALYTLGTDPKSGRQTTAACTIARYWATCNLRQQPSSGDRCACGLLWGVEPLIIPSRKQWGWADTWASQPASREGRVSKQFTLCNYLMQLYVKPKIIMQRLPSHGGCSCASQGPTQGTWQQAETPPPW